MPCVVCAVCGVWCRGVCDAWCVVCGVWCVVCGVCGDGGVYVVRVVCSCMCVRACACVCVRACACGFDSVQSSEYVPLHIAVRMMLQRGVTMYTRIYNNLHQIQCW